MYNQVYMKKFKLYYLKKKRIKDLVAAWKYEDQSRKQKEKKKKKEKSKPKTWNKRGKLQMKKVIIVINGQE